jgi:hypothetical protein
VIILIFHKVLLSEFASSAVFRNNTIYYSIPLGSTSSASGFIWGLDRSKDCVRTQFLLRFPKFERQCRSWQLVSILRSPEPKVTLKYSLNWLEGIHLDEFWESKGNTKMGYYLFSSHKPDQTFFHLCDKLYFCHCLCNVSSCGSSRVKNWI